MTIFFAFLISGFLELWPLLMFWGFSAGPVNAVPFVVLVGCFLLIFVAAPLALFIHRVSAVLALLASASMLAWPIAGVWTESDISGLVFAVPPVFAGSVASWVLWRTRHAKWLAVPAKPPVWARIALSSLPFILFLTLFNARLVLALLLSGP